MLPTDLPTDMPSFQARFGTDEQCRDYLFKARWPDGFRCTGCGHGDAWRHKKRLIDECVACGKQHSLLAGTIFEQTKTGLARWFLAIYLVTSGKRGISAMELKRQMGFGSYGTAWAWLHKIRRAMVVTDRKPLGQRVEADETLVGGARPGKPGRGAAGKTLVAGAVETGRGKASGRRLGRLRLAKRARRLGREPPGLPRPQRRTARPRSRPTAGGAISACRPRATPRAGQSQRQSWGDAAFRLPAIHLVFSLAKRWLIGTHHGAVSAKHLPTLLDEYVFRFNRRTAKSISHGFARLVEQAVITLPTTYRAISHPA